MDHDITDLNALHDGFRASMRGSACKEGAQRFEMDWLSEIVKIKREVENRTYETQAGSEFLLNERGRVRRIHGVTMRDRVLRHALCDGELEDKLAPYLHYNNCASQRGKGLSFAREAFAKDLHNYWLEHRTNDGYVAFVDMSKFYDNIRHDKIRETMYPHISPTARWVMDKILEHFRVDVSYLSDEAYATCLDRKHDSVAYYAETTEAMRTGEKWMSKGVDIGDQASQNIGVFFPTPMDNYASTVRGCRRYGRYTDDIAIVHHDKRELRDIVEGICRVADALGLYINAKKTRIVKLSQTYKYLQIKYTLTDTGRVIKRINPKNVTRERRRLKAYKRQLDAGRITYEDVEQSAKSWMGTYAKLMSKDQIRHMKALYKALFGKELIWKSKSHSAAEKPSQPKKTENPLSRSRNRVSRRSLDW